MSKKAMPHSKSNHEFERLEEALDDAEELSDNEIDIVLLPPNNTEDGDTDTEMGNDLEARTTGTSEVYEVCGHIEVQTSKRATKSSKTTKEKDKSPPSLSEARQRLKQEKQTATKIFHDTTLFQHDTVNKLLQSVENLELLHESLKKNILKTHLNGVTP